MRVPIVDNRDVDFKEFARAEFDDASCAISFDDTIRKLVLDYKFNGAMWLRDDLVDFMLAAGSIRLDLAAVDVVVPVPTTFWHWLDRGGFPVGDLADEVARRIDRPYLPRTLARCGHPRRQSSLSEKERPLNMSGTVRVRDSRYVRGRTVLLVDDILTTGSTLSECSSVLKAAGAWRVWGLTLARSVRS